MNVRTNLKAGGVIGKTSQKAANMVSQAEEQANNLGGTLLRTTTSLWNCLKTAYQAGQGS